MMNFIKAAIAALAVITGGAAQAQIVVAIGASRLDVASQVATIATTAGVLTLTPQAGQSVYLAEVHITNCAGASAIAGAAVTTATSTNANGAAWTIGNGTGAGVCAPEIIDTFGGVPMKASSPGTAVTLTLPAFSTNQTLRMSAYWYSAP